MMMFWGIAIEKSLSTWQIDDVGGDGGQGQRLRVKVQDDESKGRAPKKKNPGESIWQQHNSGLVTK